MVRIKCYYPIRASKMVMFTDSMDILYRWLMMMRMRLVVVISAVLLLMVDSSVMERILSRSRRELASPLHARGIRDPFGSYCERRGGCCEGRNDECTMPYLDTICYCDLFCNRTVSDCCPDFWGHCLGIQPPPRGQWSSNDTLVEAQPCLKCN